VNRIVAGTVSDPLDFTVTPIILMIHGDAPRASVLSYATGFFYKFNDKRYLITNRHVVINEDEKYYPDTLLIKIHTNRNTLREIRDVIIKLYSEKGDPVWYEYPHKPSKDRTRVDIIAIDLEKYVRESDVIHCINQEDIPQAGSIGEDEIITMVGYPLGIYDTLHNTPIKRKCTVASYYGRGFEGDPFFVVDANIHPGISGSPVVEPYDYHFEFEGKMHSSGTFYGVFSGEFTPDGIESGLGIVWYPELVQEIVENEVPGSIDEESIN
jgi:hypothetical protein